jgi:hypothetical protein
MDLTGQAVDATPRPGPIPLPADALIFRFPSSLPWMMLGCSILGVAFMVFACVTWLAESNRYLPVLVFLCVVVCGPLSALALRSFCRLRDSIAVNDQGIWYLPRKGESTFIGWCEVARVMACDTQQRLVVVDSTGKSIRLEYQLEGFGRLREFVLGHTPLQTRLPRPGETVFHRSWINKVMLLGSIVVFLMAGWASNHQGQPRAALAFIVFAVALLFSITSDPLRLLVGQQSVVIVYPGWERTVLFKDIDGISLADESLRGNVWAAVVINTLHGRPIKTYRFREGSLALYETLYAAWKHERAACGHRTELLK